MHKKTWALHGVVILAAIAFFFIQGPEFIYHLADRTWDGGDSLYHPYILDWICRSLFDPHHSIWDVPFMYPVKNVTAFSETLLGNLWLALPIQKIWHNSVLTANLIVPISFVLTCYAVFLLCFEISASFWGSLFAGLLFSYNPYRWGQIEHLQLIPFYWAPLAFLYFTRYLKNWRTADLIKTAVFIAFQYYSSVYIGTTVITALVFFFGVFFLGEKNGRERKKIILSRTFWRQISLATLTSLLLIAPLGYRYLIINREWGFQHGTFANLGFSVEPLAFLLPRELQASYLWLRGLFGDHVSLDLEVAVFFGFLPWLLAGLGFWASRRKKIKLLGGYLPAPLARRFGISAILLGLTMMGPRLIFLKKVLPVPILPYLFFYVFIPGGKAMRVPARFSQVLLLCLAVLASLGIKYLFAQKRFAQPAKKALCIVALFIALVLDYRLVPYAGVHSATSAEMPEVGRYLARGGADQPYVDIPLFIHNPPFRFPYFSQQAVHWRPTIGDQSSFVVPAPVELSRRVGGTVTVQAMRTLSLSLAQTVVIHLDLYSPEIAATWEHADPQPYGFKVAGKFQNDLVWERTSSPERLAQELVISGVEPRKLVESIVPNDDVLRGMQIVLSPPSGESWRYVDHGATELRIEIQTVKKNFHFRQRIQLPSYLLSGESESLKIRDLNLNGVPLSEVRQILFSGDFIASDTQSF
jgi:hypothetical protein